MPVIAPAVISGGIGLAKTITGFVNKGKAKAEAKELEKTRPKLGRDALADENLALANSDLAQGNSAVAERAYGDIADREFSSSLSSIMRGGGSLNSIGDIYGGNDAGRRNLAIMKDNLRLSQIQQKINASAAVRERDADMFKYNVDAPWKDKAQANAAARTESDNQIWDGLQTLGSSAMQFSGSKGEAKKLGLTDAKGTSSGGVGHNYDSVLGLGGGHSADAPVGNKFEMFGENHW